MLGSAAPRFFLAATRSTRSSLLRSHSAISSTPFTRFHRNNSNNSSSGSSSASSPPPSQQTSSASTTGVSPGQAHPALETNATPVDAHGFPNEPIVETSEEAREIMSSQAPNRTTTWAPSQEVRAKAMSGPRFEQTIMQTQPRPYAAIELIHQQPVRWTHESVVSCDGGGGALGHPRIFINTDRPEILYCEYCGNPFANEHNRKAIEADPNPPYPLE